MFVATIGHSVGRFRRSAPYRGDDSCVGLLRRSRPSGPGSWHGPPVTPGAGEAPVMTLASSDPKARSLYSRFGMAVQWECHYVEGDPARVDRGVTSVAEDRSLPVGGGRPPHLRDDLAAASSQPREGMRQWRPCDRIVIVVAPTGDPIESVGRGARLGGPDRGDHRMRLHLSDRHPTFSVLTDAGFVEDDVDTLMASPGAEVPDPTRITFNGDMLRLSLARRVLASGYV